MILVWAMVLVEDQSLQHVHVGGEEPVSHYHGLLLKLDLCEFPLPHCVLVHVVLPPFVLLQFAASVRCGM